MGQLIAKTVMRAGWTYTLLMLTVIGQKRVRRMMSHSKWDGYVDEGCEKFGMEFLLPTPRVIKWQLGRAVDIAVEVYDE